MASNIPPITLPLIGATSSIGVNSMLKITKTTFFILTLLVSTAVFARAELEIESTDSNDPNTKKLTEKTVVAGAVFSGIACCNKNWEKAEPYYKGNSLQVHFHLPLGSEMRVWLQDKQKHGKVTCNEERVGCVSVDLLSELDRNLDGGISIKNQCGVKPRNRLLPGGAYIGLQVIKGSVTVDGIDEPFTCKETPTISEGRKPKKVKRAAQPDVQERTRRSD
jgi:hypothetical protein